MLIIAYHTAWVTQFDQIREKLLDKLSGLSIRIEHIGSTAVPGLAAKPIIDIDIVYQTTADFEPLQNGLVSLGYYHNGDQGIPGRAVFKRNGENNDDLLDGIDHHLYACMYDCDELHRHILLRDYLRKHETAKQFYQQLKYEIAAEANGDRKQYASIKALRASSFLNYIIGLSHMEQVCTSAPTCSTG